MKGTLRKEAGLMGIGFHWVCPYCHEEMVLLEASRQEINFCLKCGLVEQVGYGDLALRELNRFRKQDLLPAYTQEQYDQVLEHRGKLSFRLKKT